VLKKRKNVVEKKRKIRGWEAKGCKFLINSLSTDLNVKKIIYK
jgi:hypothetical protein